MNHGELETLNSELSLKHKNSGKLDNAKYAKYMKLHEELMAQ